MSRIQYVILKILSKSLKYAAWMSLKKNKKYIDKLYEKMRYSDPVSSPEVAQENEKIND